MKKIPYIIAASSLAFAASTLNAETGIFGSYIGIDVNNTSNTFYGAQQPGPNNLTNFNGLDLGTFNTNEGDSLTLSGAEVLTFKNNGSDVTGAEIQWKINRVTAPSTIGTFTSISIGFTENASFNDAAGNNFTGNDDQKWASLGSIQDLLSGLTVGSIAAPINYELEVFFKSFTNDGDKFSNNTGSNFKATFAMVPEPGTSALLAGCVALAAIAMRRR